MSEKEIHPRDPAQLRRRAAEMARREVALAPNPDFSSYFAPERAVRSKRQITKGIGNEEAVEWKTVCVAPDQSVCSACFAKRANAARDQRSILARTALSLRFCLVAAW